MLCRKVDASRIYPSVLPNRHVVAKPGSSSPFIRGISRRAREKAYATSKAIGARPVALNVIKGGTLAYFCKAAFLVAKKLGMGKSRPRSKELAAITTLRDLGQREVRERLTALNEQQEHRMVTKSATCIRQNRASGTRLEQQNRLTCQPSRARQRLFRLDGSLPCLVSAHILQIEM